jgi:hypothetical protein
MSNLIPANVKIPAHLAARMGQPSALAQALAGGISTSGDYSRISIKGSRFRIIEDGTETVLKETQLDVVIVGANPRLSKTWYAKEWNKDSEHQPTERSVRLMPAQRMGFQGDAERSASEGLRRQEAPCRGRG